MKKLIAVTIFFVIALYIVELSPIGSESVAKYNQGYGTFDMKKYNASIVEEVLGKMDTEGFKVYKKYYLADDLFVIAFGLFQIVLLQTAFSWVKFPIVLQILCLIPFLRGVADLVENTVLLTTLFQYPHVSNSWIGVASAATTMKLLLIKVWSCTIVVEILGWIIKRFHH